MPWRWLSRQAQSSMPTIEGGGKLRGPMAAHQAQNLSLLTTTSSRREREPAGLPPSAMARQ